jgi:hypothetical protein
MKRKITSQICKKNLSVYIGSTYIIGAILSMSFFFLNRCIPYMLKDDDIDNSCCLKDDHVLDKLQVLMISTPKRMDLIFPKVSQSIDEII